MTPGEAPAKVLAAHDAAQRHPHVADLDVASVYRGAYRLYRREPVRVSVAALMLLGPGLAVGIGINAYLDRVPDDTVSERLVLAGIVAIVATILGTLGTVAYAGVLDELVGAVIRGERVPNIGAAIRATPLGRLILADLVVTAIVGVASAALVLPAFVLLAMLSTVGPIVNIERQGVFASIRRALSLTFPHLWLTLTTIGVPLALEIGIEHYVLHLEGDIGLVVEFVLGLPMIFTVGVVVGLNEVELAYALLARDPESTVAAMVRTSLAETTG